MAILISSMDHHHNPQEAEEPEKASHLDAKSASAASLQQQQQQLAKKKPNRWYLSIRNRLVRNCSSGCSGSGRTSSNMASSSGFPWFGNLSFCIVGTILVCLSTHRVISLIMTHRRWINAPITYLSRECPTVAYERLVVAAAQQQSHLSSSISSSTQIDNNMDLKICITTLTDQKSPSKFQRFIRWRNFDGILDLTWPNKQQYANRHGYHLYDGSIHIDTSRPPAWSKIKAVQYLFDADHMDDHRACDWVMWTDADTVIMNSTIRILDFLPADSTKDLLVGSDKGGGYNSGVFVFRNSPWSRQFLSDWWNMTHFVRPPGFSLSGDNAALKAFLQEMHDIGTFDDHVLVPPRCTFNSFAKFLTLGESLDIMDHLQEKSWHMDTEHYHKGDFIAHIPGVDNKVECLKLLLAETRR